jgi:GT2 family glycosyltransferase
MTRLWRFFPRSPFGRYRMTAFDHETERDVVQPQATCLLVRREVFDAVGLLDAERYPIYFNDVEWCTRLHREGRLVRFLPAARVIHGYGLTTRMLAHRRKRWRESLLLYLDAWHGGASRAPGRLLVRVLTLPWVWTDRSPPS